jgi:transcriptional regulator with XRE-family HTH domain
MTVTGAQVREARELLGWTQIRLARAAKVSQTTACNVERDGARLTTWAQHAVRAALESAGVIFVEENGGGPGVRLREAR